MKKKRYFCSEFSTKSPSHEQIFSAFPIIYGVYRQYAGAA